ncbi:MAG TPA: hypothetical protein VK459_22140 [Polyangiaceae bacterium]|nr:hypothetical protein [Polyangiaceae bacterium]
MTYLIWGSTIAFVVTGVLACSNVAPEGANDDLAEETENRLIIQIGGGDDDDDDDNDDDDGPPVINPKRELLITDISVVEDPVRTKWPVGTPTGAQATWTFGRLMEQMAGSTDPSAFVLAWLQQWKQDQVINGFTAVARPSIQTLVIAPWLAASGGVELNLRKAPFRLLAIVNRLDLRHKDDDADTISAGEGRFVFGLLDAAGAPLPFTVIFEYGIEADSDKDVKKWAKKWHELGEMPFGSSFNAKLQKLTNEFTAPVCSSKPNDSCLNQLRTNEVSLSAAKLWELREFRISAQTGSLLQRGTSQMPDESLNGTAALAAFINGNQAAAKQRRHVVPPNLLAASAPSSLSTFWSAPGIIDSEARFGFALMTCNGCHTAETDTTFLHVKNRAAGVESGLSAFLTGTSVLDPVSGVERELNDLARRAEDMQYVLTVDADDLFEDDD